MTKRIHFLLPADGPRYGTACAPAFLVVGGKRAAVISKQLTPHRQLVTCSTCKLMVETALTHARQERN
jgi:hypothetical protein